MFFLKLGVGPFSRVEIFTFFSPLKEILPIISHYFGPKIRKIFHFFQKRAILQKRPSGSNLNKEKSIFLKGLKSWLKTGAKNAKNVIFDFPVWFLPFFNFFIFWKHHKGVQKKIAKKGSKNEEAKNYVLAKNRKKKKKNRPCGAKKGSISVTSFSGVLRSPFSAKPWFLGVPDPDFPLPDRNTVGKKTEKKTEKSDRPERCAALRAACAT